MHKKRQVAIYGAGGFAREVAWLLSIHERNEIFECVGYIDDNPNRKAELNGKPVFSWEQFAQEYPHTLISIGVGDPKTRCKIAKKCSQAGFEFATLIHHSVEISEFVSIGKGSTVCCGSILTVDIELGEQILINPDCTIGHDVTIGDFTTLAPGVHVSGNVKIGSSVYIGTGANIINGTSDEPLIISDNCVIGAGACITANTEANTLYVGVPAQLKKRYA